MEVTCRSCQGPLEYIRVCPKCRGAAAGGDRARCPKCQVGFLWASRCSKDEVTIPSVEFAATAAGYEAAKATQSLTRLLTLPVVLWLLSWAWGVVDALLRSGLRAN